MSSQLDDLVVSCVSCEEHCNKQPQETLLYYKASYKGPEVPWTKIGIGVIQLCSKTYLRVVKMSNAESGAEVNTHRKDVFKIWGSQGDFFR